MIGEMNLAFSLAKVIEFCDESGIELENLDDCRKTLMQWRAERIAELKAQQKINALESDFGLEENTHG